MKKKAVKDSLVLILYLLLCLIESLDGMRVGKQRSSHSDNNKDKGEQQKKEEKEGVQIGIVKRISKIGGPPNEQKVSHGSIYRTVGAQID